MEKHELRHITYDGYEVQTESAVRDSQGRKLNELRYVFSDSDDERVNNGDYVLFSDDTATKTEDTGVLGGSPSPSSGERTAGNLSYVSSSEGILDGSSGNATQATTQGSLRGSSKDATQATTQGSLSGSSM